MDATSVEKYGSQEGVEKGYVGADQPESCYQYLLIYFNNRKTFLYGTIRAGSSHSQNDFCGYLTRIFHQISVAIAASLVWALRSWRFRDLFVATTCLEVASLKGLSSASPVCESTISRQNIRVRISICFASFDFYGRHFSGVDCCWAVCDFAHFR